MDRSHCVYSAATSFFRMCNINKPTYPRKYMKSVCSLFCFAWPPQQIFCPSSGKYRVCYDSSYIEWVHAFFCFIFNDVDVQRENNFHCWCYRESKPCFIVNWIHPVSKSGHTKLKGRVTKKGRGSYSGSWLDMSLQWWTMDLASSTSNFTALLSLRERNDSRQFISLHIKIFFLLLQVPSFSG